MDNYIQDRRGAYFVEPVVITDVVRDNIFTAMEKVEGRVLRVDTYTFTDHPDGNGGTFTLYAAVLFVMTTDQPAPYAEADRYRDALQKLWNDALKSRHYSNFNDHTVNVARAALNGEGYDKYKV